MELDPEEVELDPEEVELDHEENDISTTVKLVQGYEWKLVNNKSTIDHFSNHLIENAVVYNIMRDET